MIFVVLIFWQGEIGNVKLQHSPGQDAAISDRWRVSGKAYLTATVDEGG